MFFKLWRSNNKLEQELQQHLPMLERIVASYEANPAIAEEVMQEVVLAIFNAFDKFQGQSSSKTYFARIAHNRCISHVDKAVKQVATQTIDDGYSEQQHSADKHTLIEHDMRKQQLDKLIHDLPLLQRQVFTLFLEGFSYQQIADICGTGSSNVGVILSRLKKQFSVKFQQEQ
ncbi:RNA polymerase sigma factor [Thalassotalea sp. Y01]|uniref:RNA polymerase sigma factor n=1 Tax=Thalassotalea sp. Y01 TaxID=2729613 RepID=UPI00145E7AA5|nr:RNA polymerase sigma factor [Thalassotalea sp. Y01]NMP16986.1 RNA polymerase sigma factor [Thalassotalea sp. Y01]